MKRCRSVCLAAGALVLASLAPAPGGAITNQHLRVSVDDQTGALTELRDGRTGFNLMADAGAAEGLWRFEPAGTNAPIAATNATVFQCELDTQKPPGLRLVWSGFPRHAGLKVEARVTLDPAQPVSRWHLQWTGLDNRQVGKIHFPVVPSIRRQTGECLAVPVWMGQLMREPREPLARGKASVQRHQWEYPGFLSFQCLAFYAPLGTGLYLAADDTAAFRKAFAITTRGPDELGCDVTHLPEVSQGGESTWIMPYQVVLGTFTGDWVTAAERYRSWAVNQVWARESRLARGLVPDWILNTALWVWNRGRSDGVLQPAVELQQRLELPVSVFWHWWHGCSYDAGFPEYLPPREGAEPFREAMARAQAQQVRALVYMNQRLWGQTTRSWTNEQAERWAVKGADGKIHPEIYNTFTRQPCVPMCMGTEFWRRKYAGLAEEAIVGLGVDGIYMDQACTSLACYDPTHPHPQGGGAYWIEGFRQMSQDIRDRAAAGNLETRAAGLAGEGCGEPWLPYLDLMLSLQVSKERYAAPNGWETIPFFHAVYHAYAVLYGNYSSLTMPPYDDLWPAEFAPKEPLKLLDRKFSRQFLMEQARAFVWGQQPTIANFLPEHLVSRPTEMEYVLNAARLRQTGQNYLLRGTFLRPPAMAAPEAVLDMSRLSIYAGQQGGLTTFQQRFPLVQSGAWRAPGGAVAVALASIAEEPMKLRLNLDLEYYRLPRNSRMTLIDPAGRRNLGRVPRNGEVTLELPPRALCLLELTGAIRR